MIEYPGSWPAEPLDLFGDDIRDELTSAAKAVSGQVLLVRRPDQHLRSAAVIHALPHRWWLVDTATGRQLDGTWTVEADLRSAADALRSGVPTEAANLALLVCCHAKRDQCCAIEGRPLATDLAAQWREATWQCTHLGGHRFAPTFLILPDGVCYGRVPSKAGPELVSAQLRGEVAVDFLRGFCSQSPWEQAAVADVLGAMAAPDPPGDDEAELGQTATVARGVASEMVMPGLQRAALGLASPEPHVGRSGAGEPEAVGGVAEVDPRVPLGGAGLVGLLAPQEARSGVGSTGPSQAALHLVGAGMGVSSQPLAPDQWRVTVIVAGVAHHRVVRAEPNAPVPLSCGDAPPKRSVTYRVVG